MRSLATSDDCGCAYVTKHDRELGQRSIEWTLSHTGKAAEGLHARPAVRPALHARRRRVRLVHGSPRKVNEYLFEDKPQRTFERIAALADCDVLVFGHTHKPWIHSYGGVLFVNCGSVGKPKDGDPRAAFALLEAGAEGEVAASIERVRVRRRGGCTRGRRGRAARRVRREARRRGMS